MRRRDRHEQYHPQHSEGAGVAGGIADIALEADEQQPRAPEPGPAPDRKADDAAEQKGQGQNQPREHSAEQGHEEKGQCTHGEQHRAHYGLGNGPAALHRLCLRLRSLYALSAVRLNPAEHQLVERHAEEPAHRHELVQLRHRASGLPLGYGLSGDVQLRGQVALREPMLRPEPVYSF